MVRAGSSRHLFYVLRFYVFSSIFLCGFASLYIFYPFCLKPFADRIHHLYDMPTQTECVPMRAHQNDLNLIIQRSCIVIIFVTNHINTRISTCHFIIVVVSQMKKKHNGCTEHKKTLKNNLLSCY